MDLLEKSLKLCFDPIQKGDLTPGVLYSLIKDIFPSTMKNTSFSQIPFEIRENNEEIKFQPTVTFTNEDGHTVISVGNHMFMYSQLHDKNEDFYDSFLKYFQRIAEQKIWCKLSRIELKSVFEGQKNSWTEAKVQANIGNISTGDGNNHFSIQFVKESDEDKIFIFATNSAIRNEDKEQIAVIDVSIQCENVSDDEVNTVFHRLSDKINVIEKEIFEA